MEFKEVPLPSASDTGSLGNTVCADFRIVGGGDSRINIFQALRASAAVP